MYLSSSTNSVQYTASASRTSRVLLKIPKCLYYSTMHEKQVFCFFYKIETQKQMPLLVLKRSNYKSNGVILHFFKLSSYRYNTILFFFVSLTKQEVSFFELFYELKRLNQTKEFNIFINNNVKIDFLLTRTNSLIGSNLELK